MGCLGVQVVYIVNVLILQPYICYKYARSASCDCCAWKGYKYASTLVGVGVPLARKKRSKAKLKGCLGVQVVNIVNVLI